MIYFTKCFSDSQGNFPIAIVPNAKITQIQINSYNIPELLCGGSNLLNDIFHYLGGLRACSQLIRRVDMG